MVVGRRKDENTQQLKTVRDFLLLFMHFSDSIKIKYHPYNKHRVFLTGGNSVSTGEGHKSGGKVNWLVSDNWDNLLCCRQTTQGLCPSAHSLKPDSAFVTNRLCTTISALQKTRPLADKVQKYWEIQTSLIGQLSNMLPQCDIKKERGEIILHIKQKVSNSSLQNALT